MRLKSIFNKGSNSIFERSVPFIIAEAGVNHEGNMDLAKRLIEEAQEGGADAVKFQSYKADTLASKNSPAYWDISKEPIESQYKFFKKYDKFWKKEFEELKKICEKVGIEFLSTPFDFESVNFLNEIVEAFKISSSDITNKPLIEHICKKGKPIILSTGASRLDEIHESVSWISSYNIPVALLHCILNYPTNLRDANLGMILDLKSKYPDLIIGYSDHTLPGEMKVCEIAYLFGAQIIEKHFTYDKTLQGNDHYHSMDKGDLKRFIGLIKQDQLIIGSFKKQPLVSENISRINARRSLFATKTLLKGDTLKEEDIICKRPNYGIEPKYLRDVIGRRVTKKIIKDTPIKWDLIEK